MDTIPADAHAIYTTDMMYSWTGTKGAMMNLAEVQLIADRMGQDYTPESAETVVAKAEAADAKCEAATVSEELFIPPTDVEFQDMTAILRQIEGMI